MPKLSFYNSNRREIPSQIKYQVTTIYGIGNQSVSGQVQPQLGNITILTKIMRTRTEWYLMLNIKHVT